MYISPKLKVVTYSAKQKFVTLKSWNLLLIFAIVFSLLLSPFLGMFSGSLSSEAYASGLSYEWAKAHGGYFSRILVVSIGTDGSVYTAGYFQSTVDFDPGAGTSNLTSDGLLDMFISKLDSDGNFVWAKRMGGTGTDTISTIFLDDSNNIYSTGGFAGTVDFDPGAGTSNLTSAGSNDVFISKLDSNGDFVWAKKVGGGTGDYAYNVIGNGTTSVYLSGTFTGTVDFDPGVGTSNLVSNGSVDMFFLKIDSDGNYIWAKQIGGNDYDEPYAMNIDD